MRQVNVFAEFKNSIKRQVEENKELQKDVKLLAQEGQKVTESETMKNAKATTSKVINAVGSAVDATLQNPVVQGTGKILYKTVETVADVSQKVYNIIYKGCRTYYENRGC
jgi:import inner membrane translocase subunit TIM44